MAKTLKPTKPRVSKTAFTVDATLNGATFSAKGATIDEAVLALKVPVPKTAITLTIAQKGSTPITLGFRIPFFKRLQYPGLTGQIQRINLIKRYQMLHGD